MMAPIRHLGICLYMGVGKNKEGSTCRAEALGTICEKSMKLQPNDLPKSSKIPWFGV